MSDNHIASPEDFKKAAGEANAPERVVLPKSGLAVLLRRPTAFAVAMLDGELADLAQAEDWRGYFRVMQRALGDAMVQPKLSLTPGPNEIHPSWLPEEDQTFLLHWIRGFIAPDGTDLVEKFFRERGKPVESRPGGQGSDYAAVEDPGAVGSVRDAG